MNDIGMASGLSELNRKTLERQIRGSLSAKTYKELKNAMVRRWRKLLGIKPAAPNAEEILAILKRPSAEDYVV